MSLGDLTSVDAVEQALDEFDQLGRDAFLDRYGFGTARRYFIVTRGREYDSKAVAAAAHGFEHPDRGPLQSEEFSGGEQTVAPKLRSLGYEVTRSAAQSRNPPWAADEVILALDVYMRSGMLDDTSDEVVKLSEILNRLPIHADRPDAARFRNPNGVALKLANFAAFDPDYPGVGMVRGSRLDREIWDRFSGDRDELHRLAQLIRSDAIRDGLTSREDDEDSVIEGKLVYRSHRARERDRSVVDRKKRSVLKARGELRCEACDLEFGETYGELGAGFIECHHTLPLSQSGERKTSLADLALLCSNCHRMLHRAQPWPSVSELRSLVHLRRTSE